MRYELDTDGAWLVDPNELALRLGMATSHLLSQMRRGLVSTTIVSGSGLDEGRSRITVQAAGTAWQGTFDDGGTLMSEVSF